MYIPNMTKSKFYFGSNPEPIAPTLPSMLLQNDIREAVRKSPECKIVSNKSFDVYLFSAKQIPNIIEEIGRLREITFREIGEGTSKDRDLDKYDQWYNHLVLWDNDSVRIVGAYRLGFGPDIFTEYGMRGFYLRSLFKIKKQGRYLFENGLEMGRAFIIPEYQMRPTPLFLLWKGIIHIVLENPELKYILGSVSISSRFSNTSRSLIVKYIKKYFFDADFADYVKPKKVFKPKLDILANEVLLKTSPEDINRLDKLIAQLEPDGIRFPVLLKKYLTQNARVVGFNVDPAFGHSLDGFMYINTTHLPEKTLRPVLEELESIKGQRQA